MHTIAVSVTKNLQEEECIYTTNSKVPYNTYGRLFAMKCDDNQIGLTSLEFPFPKPTEKFGTLNDYGYFYQCCRTGPGQHFIQDTAFNWTLYPQIIISCISSFISALLAVALTIPLWRWLQYKKGNPSTLTKRQRQQQQQQQHNNNNQSSSNQHQQTEYSSYNLYLVFLSLPDFILNVYLANKYGQYASDSYDTNHWSAPHIIANVEDQVAVLRESTIVLSCACANLYLNAIVAYEVLVLLTDSFQRKHHTPPSIKRVTLQASLVYVITIIISLVHFYGGKKLLSDDDDNLEYVLGSLILELVISLVFVFGIPLAYLIYVCIVIWRKKLMPDVEGRLKELAYFFFRIILVFVVFWLPGMSLVIMSHLGDYFPIPYEGIFAVIGLIFCGLQPVGSFIMAMTKSDVKKYVIKLVTLSYCQHYYCNCCSKSKQNDSQDQSEAEVEAEAEVELTGEMSE